MLKFREKAVDFEIGETSQNIGFALSAVLAALSAKMEPKNVLSSFRANANAKSDFFQ